MAVLAILVALSLTGTVLAINSLKPCTYVVPDCVINPCVLATCPNYMDAECRDFMCGLECKAEFWVKGVEVTSQCRGDSGGTSNFLNTLLKPVEKADSAATGNPVIHSGSLGSISPSTQPAVPESSAGHAKGKAHKKPPALKALRPPFSCYVGGCPQGTPVAMCTAPPCQVSSCPAFPRATCRNSYCGGCNAVFTFNGQDVTSQCNSNGALSMMNSPQTNGGTFQGGAESPSGCPPTRPPLQCGPDPCTFSTCARFPRATCRSSNCGGCFARFFLGEQDVTSYCAMPQRPQQPRWGNPHILPYYFLGFRDLMGY